MGVQELAMVVDFTGEIGVLLARRFEHDLRLESVLLALHNKADEPYLRSIGELVRRQVDFAE